jgi:hypothetical protein
MKHPTKFMREVLDIIRNSGVPIRTLTQDAGVSWSAFYRWERGVSPRMVDVIAVLNTLGMTIVIRKTDDDT